MNNDVKKYLEICRDIELGKFVSEDEMALVRKVRKADNESVLNKYTLGEVVYYICDRSGASTQVTEGENSKNVIIAGGKEYGLKEYFDNFKDVCKESVVLTCENELELQVWSEDSDYLERESKFLLSVAKHTFAEITMIYTNIARVIEK